MADFNPILEVDAGKILAKLHLAGQSQVQNAVVINTAIKNPDKKATPDSPGNVEFDLENKTGEYQLAIIRPLEYNVPIDPMKNKEYVKAKEALDKFMKDHEKDLPKNDEEGGEKEEGKKEGEEKKEGSGEAADKEKKKDELDKKTSLTDKKAQEKTQVEDSLEVPSFLDFITEADDKKEEDDKEDKEKQKLQEELKNLQKPMLKVFADYDIPGYEVIEDKDKNTDYAATSKKFEEALTAENKKRIEAKKKLTEECKKAALADLKKYFINFAGKDNQAKIKDADIVVKNATAEDHVSEPKELEDSVKEYKIEVDEVDKKIQENQDKMQQDPNKISKEVYAHDIALIVGYKVDIT